MKSRHSKRGQRSGSRIEVLAVAYTGMGAYPPTFAKNEGAQDLFKIDERIIGRGL